MKTMQKIAPFYAGLIMLCLPAGEVGAAVVAVVKINSPMELEIMLSGSLGSPAASNFPNSISLDLGDSISKYTNNIYPVSIIGGYGQPPFQTDGILFNNTASAGDTTGLVSAPISFQLGDLFSGTATFTYGVPHQIKAGDAYRLYWGSTVPNAGGSLQSFGTVVPEPSAITLIGLVVLGITGSRRARC